LMRGWTTPSSGWKANGRSSSSPPNIRRSLEWAIIPFPTTAGRKPWISSKSGFWNSRAECPPRTGGRGSSSPTTTSSS